MSDRLVVEPDLDFIQHVRAAGGDTLKKCYQCATCSTVCELSPAERPFPRKEMIWAQWGMKDRLLSDPDVWLCHQCNDCSTRCPRDARPGDVLAAVRDYVYASFTYPRFMGHALANPAMLPLLLLIPILIVGALVGINMSANGHDLAYFFNSEEVMLTEFVPSGIVEMLFIGGNILIFLIAGVGLYRFWKGLNHDAAVEGGPGFVPSLIQTILEIAGHKRFSQCGQNQPRQVAHLLVMYGFFGAAATAGLALIRLLIGMHGPIDLPNPIKILGAVSGIMILVGSTMMLIRRATNADHVGANGYADRLFLWMVFLVGLTGLLSWLFRWAGIGEIAYPTYFIHIVFVFFILWYMPYSKFAHMLYRTLAMVWARSHKRILGQGLVVAAPVVADSDSSAA